MCGLKDVCAVLPTPVSLHKAVLSLVLGLPGLRIQNDQRGKDFFSPGVVLISVGIYRCVTDLRKAPLISFPRLISRAVTGYPKS